MAKEKQGRRGFIKGAGLMAGSVLSSSIVTSSAAAQPVELTASAASKGAQLRGLLANPDPVVAPIVPDILTARLCELEGFQAVLIGDSQSLAWYGIPGFGLLSMTELTDFAVHIAAHTELAVIADMEDGGGSPLRIHRATQELERGGVAAVMFEDVTPEAHFVRRGAALVSRDEMVDKIKAAVDARRDQNLVVIARSHAQEQGYSMEQALERGLAWADAGADVIYLSGMRLEDHPRAREIVKKPMLFLGTPTTTPEQAKAAKISLIAYHLDSVGHGALYQALKELKTTGTFANSSKLLLPGDVQAKLVRTEEYTTLARKYHMIK